MEHNSKLNYTDTASDVEIPLMGQLKLTDRPMYEQVAERLRARILSHRIAPGSWIDEQALCAEYGISRTPLREALKVLAAEGLVTMRPRRGAYVTEMSERDVTEVYHLLSLLESDAAAEVARLATGDELAALESMHEQLEQAVDNRERFFALNEAFHMRLLEVAGNRWRTQVVVDLRKVMKLNRHHSLFREGRLTESLNEHRALMTALLRRDATAAEVLSRAHFRNGLVAAKQAEPVRATQPA
jgi:DNA-binding GntR family transcriptional regulator